MCLILLFKPINCHAQSKEKTLKLAFQTFNTAFEKADITVLSKMLTKDYRHTNQGAAPINAASWLNYIRSRQKQLESGSLKIINYKIEEKEFLIYGNSALITGKVVGLGILDGKSFQTNLRFTQMWVNEDGKWKRAAFQDSKIMSKGD